MNDLSKLSLSELRALESQVLEALKTHNYLAISKNREQILHIAQNAGLSVKDILSTKAPKRTKSALCLPNTVTLLTLARPGSAVVTCAPSRISTTAQRVIAQPLS